MRQAHFVVAASLAAALLSSCRESATIPNEKSANAGARAAERPAIEDGSLPSASYLERGFPAHDRNWSGKDMESAARAVQTLAESNPSELPRYGSERSGEMFARIVSPQNLVIYRDKSLPLEARFPDLLLYLQSLSALNKSYVNLFLQGKIPTEDVVELQGASLRVAQVQLELAMEHWRTVSRDDPSYQVRVEGLRQVQTGLTEMVMGGLMTLSDHDPSFHPETRARFFVYCLETFPTITEYLRPTTQQEVIQRIGELARDPELGPWSKEFDQLQQVVKNATARPGFGI